LCARHGAQRLDWRYSWGWCLTGWLGGESPLRTL